VIRTFIAVLVIAASSLALGQTLRRNANRDSIAEQVVKQLENELINAQMRADTTVFGRILADDFTGTNAFGTVANKAEVLNLYKAGSIKRELVNLDDVNVRIYGDTAVVTGRATLKGQFTGQDTSGKFRYTRVYVKRNGRWQVVAWQATRIAQQGAQSEELKSSSTTGA